MAIILDEVTPLESFLSYALFACAMFQLVCIFAAVGLPHSPKELEDQVVNGSTSTGQSVQSTGRHAQDQSSRRGKKEKKKHR